MFGTFVNRIGTLLDRRFLVGSWLPALCGLLVATTAYAVAHGWRRTTAEWTGLGGPAQIWLGVAALALVTLGGFLLHVTPVIRLFEGYPLPGRLRRWGSRRQEKRRAKAGEVTSLRWYPRNRELIRPTLLGNVLTAAEEHPYLRYRIDAVVWWPRVAPVLPQVMRDQLDEALLPLVSLLNFALAFGIGGFASAVTLAVSAKWTYAVLCLAGTIFAVLVAYYCALPQARSYADTLRAAFDLYRHEVLKTMHVPLPDDLVAERKRWEELTQWVFRGEPLQLEYDHPSDDEEKS